MKILLVEDEEPKRKNTLIALRRAVPDPEVVEAKSVTSALRELRKQTFDLILLDMSLPTFDVGPGEGGGRPQGFGGIELLRSMDRYKLSVPTVVITAYEQFTSGGTQISLDTLTQTLANSHPAIFKGLVFYNSVVASWAEDLKRKISEAMLNQ
jgi:CheY-like chemotaxis protein